MTGLLKIPYEERQSNLPLRLSDAIPESSSVERQDGGNYYYRVHVYTYMYIQHLTNSPCTHHVATGFAGM